MADKIDGLKLAYALVDSETEEDVIHVLQQFDLWDNKKNWRSFGDNDNNFSTIGNQQSEADAALVEKIVNSIDAILMKECLVRGIKTDSPDAPKSIPEALEAYFGIPDGNLAEVGTDVRSRLSQDIRLIASGGIPAKGGQLNLTIVDNGEGQTPLRMPDTILSINKSNKLRVPFVQGKFNMGGTGVLRFCGSHNFQLIISRRNQDIPNDANDPTFAKWGITLIKRDVPDKDSRSSIYRYLVNEDSTVIMFDEPDGLNIVKDSLNFNQIMKSGMFCKLYNYKLKPRYATNINMGLYYRLSTLLPSLAYPIKLDETRDFKGHTMNRTLAGLNVRLSDEIKKKKSHVEYSASSAFTILGQKVSVQTFVFKEKLNEDYENDIDLSQYRETEGILLVQNGQTHASIQNRFYKKQSVNLSYLADSLLTIVDCSNINAATRENLFMNSRDRIGSCEFKDLLIEELETFFHDDENLRELQNKRRENAVSSKLNDNKPLESILKNVFKFSPVLAKLFLFGDKLTNPFANNKSSGGGVYDGRYYPTFFTLSKKPEEKDSEYIKEAHLTRKARVKFLTDAANDFFTRSKNKGSYTLFAGDLEVLTYSLNLLDGYGNLNITLEPEWQIGDVLDMKLIVRDSTNNKDFVNTFKLKIIENVEIKNDNDPYSPPGKDPNKHSLKPAGVTMPYIEEVYEENWMKYDMTEKSSLVIKRSGNDENGEAFDFFVNMDNIHLKTELKLVASDSAKVLLYKSRYKYALTLLGLSMLGYFKEHNQLNDEEKDVEAIVKENCEMISPVILPLITVLGDPTLKLNEDYDI